MALTDGNEQPLENAQAPKPQPKLWQRVVAGPVAAGVFITLICTVAGFLGALHWSLDLFANFRIQYTWLLAIAAAVLWGCRAEYKYAVAATIGAGINGVLVASSAVSLGAPPATASQIRVMAYNVNTANRNFQRCREFISTTDADMVLLMEVNDSWLTALDTLREQYPHWLFKARDDNFGIAMLSKTPLDGAVEIIGEARVPSIVAELILDGAAVTVIGTHPLPPVGGHYTRMRNEQMRRLGERVTKLNGPVILLGDLNATPWSHPYRQLCKISGLGDSAGGIWPTWPSFWPLATAIPIDHVLHSQDFGIVTKHRGPANGSDHYPLVVELGLTAGN